jgi:hypothetical protein
VTALSAPALARRLADTLEAAGVPYAVGGALALAIWGFPRATNDVDLDVFVTADALPPVLLALRRAGFDVDLDTAQAVARARGDFKFFVEGVRVDVFVSSLPLYEVVRTRIRQGVLEGRPAWFLAPEDLALFKMLFFRTKDLLDVERLVAFVGGDFDRAYVRRWLVDLVGADDERVQRWDRLLSDVDG